MKLKSVLRSLSRSDQHTSAHNFQSIESIELNFSFQNNSMIDNYVSKVIMPVTSQTHVSQNLSLAHQRSVIEICGS